MQDLAQKHTTLVIAHRLSTIIDSNNIIVLDKGEVVEQGRHQQLLDKQGLYAHLWKLQQEEKQQEEQKQEKEKLSVDEFNFNKLPE